MGCSLPGSSAHGISQQECWSGLPFLSPGVLPDPGIEPLSPALADGFYTTEPPGKPPVGRLEQDIYHIYQHRITMVESWRADT